MSQRYRMFYQKFLNAKLLIKLVKIPNCTSNIRTQLKNFSNIFSVYYIHDYYILFHYHSLAFVLIIFFVQDRGVVIVFFTLVFVSPSPDFVGSISGTLYPFLDHVNGDSSEIVSPADLGEEVNEG